MSATELFELASERGLTRKELFEALEQLPVDVSGTLLPEAEAQLFADAGVDPDERASGPQLVGVILRQGLEGEALTAVEAAELLGRDPSRIRQRVDGPGRSLLGFHRRSAGRREWLLPAFQFNTGVHELDGWAKLLQALPQADDTSPLALVRWLTAPCDHLDGKSRTTALATGYPVRYLVAEAATFGMPQ